MPLAVETGTLKASAPGSKPARSASAAVSTVLDAPVSTIAWTALPLIDHGGVEMAVHALLQRHGRAPVAVGDGQRTAGHQARR